MDGLALYRLEPIERPCPLLPPGDYVFMRGHRCELRLTLRHPMDPEELASVIRRLPVAA